jgi:glycosyltransferase involved in cell wall biosynthesis
MRIGVDCHVLAGKYQGSRTYLLNLYRAVLCRESPHEFIFFGHWNGERPFGDKASYQDYPSESRWRRLIFSTDWLVKKYQIDLFHTHYISPLRLSCRSLVTIHDILFEDNPEYFERGFTFRSKLLVKRSARRADQVHTSSEYSRDRLKFHYGLEMDKVRLVQPGIDVDSSAIIDRATAAKYVLDKFGVENFILTVGRIEPRKNHLSLLKAYRLIRQHHAHIGPLVIVGQRDFGYDSFFDVVNSESLRDHVKIMENVDDTALVNLYRAARLFVYPSFAEGFGLPVLEAMAYGVPVITSKATSLPEVTMDAAVLVDPESPNALADAIMKLIDDEDRQISMSLKGVERAKRFSWANTANQYLDAINALP